MPLMQSLENGLRVVVEEMDFMKSCAVSIWVGVGSRYESEANNGISHFIEHMLFKGTQRRKSNQDISAEIEGVGGSINGFTNREVTCYLVKVPAEHFELGIDVLSDMIANSLFLQESIDGERGVVIEEIRMVHDKPDNWVHVLLDQIMWPDQPFGRSIAGSEEVIRSLTREQILDYVEKFYSAGNMVVSVAGRCKGNQVIHSVGKLLSHRQKQAISAPEKAVSQQDKPRVAFENRQTKQTNLAIGFVGYPRLHPDRYVLEMLNVALGWGMSSRLFQEVRVKRGLAYVVGSLYSYYVDTGQFKIYAGVDPGKAAEALKVIIDELSRISASGITETELRKARDFYKGSLQLRLEDTLNLALRMGESSLLTGRVISTEEIIRRVDAVSPSDVKRVAEDVLNMNRMNIAAVGPERDGDKIRSIVGA